MSVREGVRDGRIRIGRKGGGGNDASWREKACETREFVRIRQVQRYLLRERQKSKDWTEGEGGMRPLEISQNYHKSKDYKV